ncbi:MAG: hypothetical protein ABIH52_00750 [Candidatus Aenigmatarchaeota archaeon]
MKHLDITFWALFIVIGAAVITSSLINTIIVDILLGLVIIILGVHKLSQEFTAKKITESQEQSQKKINHILEWLDKNYKYTKNMSERNDIRFDKIHQKNKETGDSVETKYRELAKRMFELENILKELSRALLSKEEVRSGRRKSL